MNNNLYQSSELNNKFTGNNLAFAEYVKATEDMIGKARTDLTEENQASIIRDNSPFELHPKSPTNKGILLIHGLYDSPLYIRDVAHYFQRQGFLVRAILLPGHGTRPGDQLIADNKQWVAALNYGIHSIQQDVEHFYLGGLSTGACLSLYAATNNVNAKGLILFSPALKPRNPKAILARWYKLFSWALNDKVWLEKNPQTNHAKYESFSYHWAAEVCELMSTVRRRLARTQINMPIFAALSADDATICPTTFLKFFHKHKNLHSRVVYYSNQPSPILDNRIVTQPSAIPEKRILHFSHVGIPIAPSNPYLGEQGEYIDLLHHEATPTEVNHKSYFGSARDQHHEGEIIARLTYNPYFDDMCAKITDFLRESDPHD